MESIISDFSIDWKTFLAQLFNFAIVFSVLYFFAFKPIIKMMSQRSSKIEQGLKDAESSRTKLLEAESNVQTLIKNANKQADVILAEANIKATVSSNKIMADTNDKVVDLLKQGKLDLIKERKLVIEEIKKESVDIAIAISEKILNNKLDVSADDDFIRKIIA